MQIIEISPYEMNMETITATDRRWKKNVIYLLMLLFLLLYYYYVIVIVCIALYIIDLYTYGEGSLPDSRAFGCFS